MFVFDNIENQDSLKEFLPPSNYAPYVLVTSQCREWDEKFDVLKLDVFSKDDAVQFIERNLKGNIVWNTEDCVNISNLLGYHPLGLQQAICYVNKANISLNDYIMLFQERKQEMLSTSINDLENKSLYMVLSLSIERIEKVSQNNTSLDLLYVISLFDGKNICKELLLKFCNDDIYILIETLNLLCKFSIVNDNASDVPILKQTVSIHSLTQFFLQKYKKEEQRVQKAIASIKTVLQKDRMDYQESHKLTILNQWYNHFRQIIQNINETDSSYYSIMVEIGFLLSESGKPNEALKVYQEVEQIQKVVIGDQHPSYCLLYTSPSPRDS